MHEGRSAKLDPLPLPDNLPQDRINILLVIARPAGDRDVGFHALSRPLVELTRDQQMPVHTAEAV